MRDSEVMGTRRRYVPASRPGRLAVTAVCGVVCLLAAACQSSSPNAVGTGRNGHGATPAAQTATRISITPGNGASRAKPSRGVAVTVVHGKLRTVKVSAGHDPAAGVMSKGGTVWHTVWPLHPGTHYTVTATAVGVDGKTVTSASSFRTLTPAATFTAQTVIGYHQTYGVGMPITITFSQPVTHKAQVERAIEVTSSKPVVGAWEWDNSQSISFRPREYWPQHTKVSFVAHFDGMEAARGVYGTSDLSQSFRIGNSLIGVTSTITHHTKIYYKNKLYQVWPDSSGQAGSPETETANGAYLTIDKGNPVLMTGQGYKNVPVYFSVRFTWSGNYYHDAPWSLGQQGYANVSHGCVNLSPAHSQWYYDHAVPGDPITIIGSPLPGNWGDGWTQWFLSWKQMLQRSATHLAVQAGPNGSTFVNPDTLPSHVSHSVIHNSRAGNYLPGNHTP